MATVLENIVLIALLLVLVLVLTPLFLVIIRRACQTTFSPIRPPKPPAPGPGTDSVRVDPWVESGRRLKMESEPASDPDPDQGPASGERFE